MIAGSRTPENVVSLFRLSPPVDSVAYRDLAQRAGEALRKGTLSYSNSGGEGVVFGSAYWPYENSPFLGFDPVDLEKKNKSRILPEFFLAVLPANPDRTTLVHELLHYLVYRARERSIVHADRLIQLGVEAGKRSYYFDRIQRKAGERLFPEPAVSESDEELTNYIIYQGQSITGELDGPSSEELEVRYFLSKYGPQLGVTPAGIDSHKSSFWEFVDRYEAKLAAVASIGRGALHQPAFSYIQKHPDLVLGSTVLKNYYLYAWDDAKQLARNYPRNLLTRSLNGSDGPSYLERYSQDFYRRPR